VLLVNSIMNESSFINATNNLNFQIPIRILCYLIPSENADDKDAKEVSVWRKE
jgi:hypothetical protein